MKKTLIASAVAAATFTTGAMAADSALEIYGDIEVAYTHKDTNDVTENGVDDNSSTLGFKHSHKISEGVTGFAKIEFEFNADQTSAGLNETDEIYVGVKGDFGSIQYGVDDTVNEWVDDLIDISENTGIAGELAADNKPSAKDIELENIQYVSPEIADGFTVGVTLPAESDSVFVGAIAGKYEADGVTVALAYNMGRKDEAGDTIALGGSMTMDALTVAATYEMRDETSSGADDGKDFFGLLGTYAMDQNQFALGYSMKSFDDSNKEDEATIYLQALHNVSDNLYVYAEWTTVTDEGGEDGTDTDTLAIGTNYSF